MKWQPSRCRRQMSVFASGPFGGEAYREGEQDDAGEAIDGAADTGPLEEGPRTVECVGVSTQPQKPEPGMDQHQRTKSPGTRPGWRESRQQRGVEDSDLGIQQVRSETGEERPPSYWSVGRDGVVVLADSERLHAEEDEIPDTDDLDQQVRLRGGSQERGEAEHRQTSPQEKTA